MTSVSLVILFGVGLRARRHGQIRPDEKLNETKTRQLLGHAECKLDQITPHVSGVVDHTWPSLSLSFIMVHPTDFPPLPLTPEEFNWSPDVLRAHDIITTAYDRASALLRQDEGDPLRLRVHSEQVVNRLVPILEALVPEVGDQRWLEASANALGAITVELERSAIVAEGRCVPL